MRLSNLKKELLSESISVSDVDWNFPDVTIISKAGNTKQKKGGVSPDSAKTEIIDPENIKPGENNKDGDEGGKGDDSDTKIGSIIQDFKTGEYGKVTSIDPSGDVTWEPVDEDELRKEGYISLKRSGLDAFIG